MEKERITKCMAKRLIAVILAAMLVLPLPSFAASEITDTAGETAGTVSAESADTQEGAAVENTESGSTEEAQAGEAAEEEEPEEEIILEPAKNRPTINGTAISSPAILKKSARMMHGKTALSC